MIRERIAIVPEERVLTMYRFWHCIDCGLQFSMLTREMPKICPRCQTNYVDSASAEALVTVLARETHDRFSQGGWEPHEAYAMILEILQAHAVLP